MIGAEHNLNALSVLFFKKEFSWFSGGLIASKSFEYLSRFAKIGIFHIRGVLN